MDKPEAIWLVICNCPEEAVARQLATGVINERLAACVNLLPAVESIYRWEGRLELAREIPLLIKTPARNYPALQDWLHAHHPYDVPEIIALPLGAGLPAYLDWVSSCTR
ncbi:divalent-cation tolerance protein CutA [Chitinilyticum litopenaei]|uniref:divalent-cation tolerance protein CutA n=1 Tax=Chitinilyticum litopenaei TaxID=1121276 RepID=UPI00040AEE49|nr:divalent-cation tolerance protein CutA [Chitinilyticum litopenaei]